MNYRMQHYHDRLERDLQYQRPRKWTDVSSMLKSSKSRVDTGYREPKCVTCMIEDLQLELSESFDLNCKYLKMIRVTMRNSPNTSMVCVVVVLMRTVI